jgi:nitrate reductase delta subunit
MTEACELLARIIEYPTAHLLDDVEHCIALLAGVCPEAAGCLSEFRDRLQPLAAGDIEEAYTRLFDFQPDHSLYIGHHLFGEDWRRSMFMAELNHWYGEAGFSSGIEMPDHIAILLRFLGRAPNAPEVAELRADCIVPALSKAVGAIEPKQALYGPALRALLVFFKQGVPASESLTAK